MAGAKSLLRVVICLLLTLHATKEQLDGLPCVFKDREGIKGACSLLIRNHNKFIPRVSSKQVFLEENSVGNALILSKIQTLFSSTTAYKENHDNT